ncbi:MFS transporter [Streptomyces rimosus]|uniref:MFS transporter n=1 Tax=Streptomyces rimosus TaxID=1927 RepID=UPI00067BBB6D|nr:MFS transporter [Streptomyces rimosus]
MTDGSTKEAPAAAPDAGPAALPPHRMGRKHFKLFILGALAAMLLSFLDENIVTSAAWQLTKELDPAHGLDRMPWLMTAYVLAATASQPLYGKLSDLFGPKPVYVCAISLFLVGSALCGLAGTMGELIAFRAVQGLGGGGLMSITLVIMATVMPPRKRSSGTGVGGGLVALGIVVGPLLGGVLCQYLSWRWIFYVNLPLGLFTLAMAVYALRLRPRESSVRRIDLLGAALVTAGASALLLIARWGGSTYAWSSPQIVWTACGAAVLIVVFVWWETRAAEPILPMSLFRHRVFRAAAPLQFIGGFAVLAVPVYVITYLQIARGASTQGSSLRLAPMALGVVIAMTYSGKMITRLQRFKPVLVLNTTVAVVALALFGLVDAHTGTVEISLLLVPLGFGLGGVVQVVLQTVQAAVEPDRLGVVTSGARFFMTLGSGFGAAVLGEVLSHRFAALLPGGTPSAGHAAVTRAYASATATTFLVAAGVMLVGLALALAIPDVPLKPDPQEEDDAPEPAAGPAPGPVPAPTVPDRYVPVP